MSCPLECARRAPGQDEIGHLCVEDVRKQRQKLWVHPDDAGGKQHEGIVMTVKENTSPA